MKKIIYGLIILSGLLAIQSACSDDPVTLSKSYPKDNAHKVTIKQGIWGNVWFWEGDFMPTIGPEGPDGSITPVARKIFIYQKTHFSSVEYPDTLSSPFIKKINSELIKTVYSDEDGFFQAELPIGEYSIFVEEKGLYYANGGDGYGFIKPAEVYQGRSEKVQIDINYLATF